MSREVLTADAFFQLAELPKEDVPFPESGNGAVIPVWGLTPTERPMFEKELRESGELSYIEFRERLVAACCRNDDGSRVFQQDDVRRLGASHAGLVERLYNKAERFSGYTADDVKATVKNSGETASAS